jgi:hypothetical protein
MVMDKRNNRRPYESSMPSRKLAGSKANPNGILSIHIQGLYIFISGRRRRRRKKGYSVERISRPSPTQKYNLGQHPGISNTSV